MSPRCVVRVRAHVCGRVCRVCCVCASACFSVRSRLCIRVFACRVGVHVCVCAWGCGCVHICLFVRTCDCTGVRSNLLHINGIGDVRRLGGVNEGKRIGARARLGSLDRPERGEHRVATGRWKIAAVGARELKYEKRGSKLAGGDRTLARRASRSNTPARTRPSHRVMHRAHEGHHFDVRHMGAPKEAVEPAVLANSIPHTKNDTTGHNKPPSGV